MTITITRAMILAAGKGVRMRPLTNDKPKALVPVAGRPLIAHAIDRLKSAGVNEIVVNIHSFADQLVSYLEGVRDVNIIISDEREALLDTGGAVLKALPHFKGEPFFTHNCDTIWAESFSNSLHRMKQRWDPARMDGLMLLAPMVRALGYDGRGDFDMGPEGALSRREEQRVAPFVWMGVQIVHPRLFDDAPGGAFSSNILFDRAIEAGRLYGIRLDGTWMHVGSPDGLAEAEAFIRTLDVRR